MITGLLHTCAFIRLLLSGTVYQQQKINLKVTIKTVEFLVVLSFLFSSKRFKPIKLNIVSAILNVLSGTKNDIRDKKRYQGDISSLCPLVINLIKAQVCDKFFHLPTFSPQSLTLNNFAND